MRGKNTRPLTPTGAKRSNRLLVFVQAHPLLIVLCVVLVAGIVLNAVAIGFAGYSVAGFRRHRNAFDEFDLLANTVVIASTEQMSLTGGLFSASAYISLDDAMDKLERDEVLLKDDLSDARENIAKGRQSIADGSNLMDAIHHYGEAVMIWLMGARRIVAREVGEGRRAQLGLTCVCNTYFFFYERYGPLLQLLHDEWKKDNLFYQSYMGADGSTLNSAGCEPYLGSLAHLDLSILHKSGPRLKSLPSVVFEPLSAPLNETRMKEDIQLGTELIQRISNDFHRKLEGGSTPYIIILILSALYCVLFLGTLLTIMFFFTGSLRQPDRCVVTEYLNLVSKTKMTSQFTQYILTLKGDAWLHLFVGDTFLYKIEKFINRVRPYISPLCFGDVETVALTVDNEVTHLHHDNADFVQASDEHSARDLRTEVGLQLAIGAVMCISVSSIISSDAPPHASGDSSEGASGTRRDLVRELISVVEDAANTHRGTIYTVGGDHIFVAWNVVSACSTTEIDAMQTALKITEYYGKLANKLSISIAYSTLVAGNIEGGKHMLPMICGPAVTRCERLETFNRYHGTTIMLDETIMKAVSSHFACRTDLCIVPVSLYRSPFDASELHTAYAVYPTRLQEKQKAWMDTFTMFRPMLLENRVSEVLELVRGYRARYVDELAPKGGMAIADLSMTVSYWILALDRLLNRSSTLLPTG